MMLKTKSDDGDDDDDFGHRYILSVYQGSGEGDCDPGGGAFSAAQPSGAVSLSTHIIQMNVCAYTCVYVGGGVLMKVCACICVYVSGGLDEGVCVHLCLCRWGS